MKTKIIISISLSFLFTISVISQDTFSIVAIDTVTGEVGSAGASCVDMNSFPGYTDDFLGELFPAVGAINTQAYYHPTNQANARDRMNQGDSPSEIIDWLINNDVSGQPQIRQYGIVGFTDDAPESAAHTGNSTDDYKNHVLGRNYSIQGNILLGQQVLDSMEARFLSSPGDLACKLMAALQGAKMVGADTRCASNGTSSLFAFVKVAQTDDPFGEPSFIQSVRTSNGDNIEPIDTLQTLFDEVHDCFYVGIDEVNKFGSLFNIYPNPAKNLISIDAKLSAKYQVVFTNVLGNQLLRTELESILETDISAYPRGIYFIEISDGINSYVSKFIKE